MKLRKLWRQNKKLFFAVSALVGTMVGVGIFGIPLAFSKAGLISGLFFMVLVIFLTLLIDTMYGEIVLRTEEKHQLIGYSRLYLGGKASAVLFFAIALSMYSALLAYIIVAGEFLSNLFSNFFYFPSAFYSIIFAVIISILILIGIKRSSYFELGFVGFFVLVIVLMVASSLSKIDLSNFSKIISDNSYWFLPFGVFLFAFGGLPTIPIQREILAGQENRLRKAIFIAVLFVAALYLLFSFIILGTTGDITSPDAISGLFGVMSGKMIFLASLFGIMAISSSFLMAGSALRETFSFDFGLKKISSWLLVAIPPILLFFSGFRNFIDIIGLGGAIAASLEGVVIVFIYVRARGRGNRVPEYSLGIPKWVFYGLIFVLAAGAFAKFLLDS